MTEHDLGSQLSDWIVGLFTAEAEASPTRDYYLVLLRQGRGVPEAVVMAVEDLLEEVRTAVSRGEPYNPRSHRMRLGLPATVPVVQHRLPRPALVRRIVLERVGATRGPQPRNRREANGRNRG